MPCTVSRKSNKQTISVQEVVWLFICRTIVTWKVAPRCWPLQSVKSNRPFPSCLKPLFQGEAKCEAIDMKMVFIHMQTKLIFTKRGFALSLVSNDESFWNLLPVVNNSVTTNVVKFSLDLQHLVPLLLDPDLPPPRGQMVPPLTANRVLKLNYSLSTWPEVNVLVRALLKPGIFFILNWGCYEWKN